MRIQLSYSLGLLLLGFLLTSCLPESQAVNLRNIPIKVSQPDSEEIDIDVVISSAEEEIREKLPDSYFGMLVFTGKCQDLPKLKGRMIVLFKQVKPSLFGQRVLFATASVSTNRSVMDLSIHDETKYYPSTTGLPVVTDNHFKEVANIAYEHIVETGVSQCDVTITQSEGMWDIRCGPLDNFVQECHFGIDAVTGRIISATGSLIESYATVDTQ